MFKKCLAEAIGTFVLVFCACGVAALTNGSLVATSLAFGLVIVAMAYSIGRISGCHINPAVSLGLFINRRMNVKEFFLYVAAQVIGGILGAVALFGILKMAAYDFSVIGDASNYVPGDFKVGPIFAAFFTEVILTCIFVFVILHVTDKESENANGKMAGIIIGLTLTLVHLIGINITGTSVNPARSIATAITSGIFFKDAEALKQVIIFIIAPLGGGALAALLYAVLNKKSAAKEEKQIETKTEETESQE